MERVEHNIIIMHNVMNEDGTEDFKVFRFWLGKSSIVQNFMSENYTENFASIYFHE